MSENSILKPSNTPCSNWLKKIKDDGFSAFEKQGLPLRWVENWRYTKPKFVEKFDFEKAPKEIIALREERVLDIKAYKIVFNNGHFISELSDITAAKNVDFYSFASLKDDAPSHLLEKINKNSDISKNSLLALNTAHIDDGFVIRIKENANIDKPIHVIFNSHAKENDVFVNHKIIIVAEKNSNATIAESHLGQEGLKYFSNVSTDVFVEENATLKHYKLQNDKRDSFHVSYNAVEVQENANYESFTLHKGADLSRTEMFIDLIGEGAKCLCDGGYLTAQSRHSDITSYIKHSKGNTFSNQMIKGVASEESKSVYQGKIYVARDAQKVDGNQLHKALLLSPKAEVDCKPELEIYADDVKCSHGATIGELDDKQLFYLRSRGISKEDARSLLIEAFLDDLLVRISDKQIREAFSSKIRIWLEDRAR
jgi:Fe-S cluster assembly protein SufD